uniref:Phosphatidate phosphatase APP1 catalytic domain-containing protein n=1 Tax=Chromera velia CCMP2878 TaxID=1169474 RepID=A0A0G4GLW0_9ALVE|eukprot:Cvel_22465.t1-p1 / transcript=Cvel_22465.t1 / gene=Cvel_22465 / organism=Chromera_velia_CCMP2878 / gene_product=hypothetical protein / transcript_product=hypothetical protein / location=Cvel_scaffold2210:11613-19887(+) / protein_length=810 / sequence_SO=supercontig / SO=protein_coding / is_pseudo=false
MHVTVLVLTLWVTTAFSFDGSRVLHRGGQPCGLLNLLRGWTWLKKEEGQARSRITSSRKLSRPASRMEGLPEVAAALLGLAGGGGGQQQGAVQNQVVVDVDDTLKSSGGVRVLGVPIGGIDSQFRRGCFYPGGFQFVLELASAGLGGGGRNAATEDPLAVAVLTARIPQTPLKPDSRVCRTMREVGKRNGFPSWGIETILYSSLKQWIFQDTKGQKKFENFSLLRDLAGGERGTATSPVSLSGTSKETKGQKKSRQKPTRFIWVGDTGELDLQTGEMMANSFPSDMRGVFLHHVCEIPEYARRQLLARQLLEKAPSAPAPPRPSPALVRAKKEWALPEDFELNRVPFLHFRTYLGAASKAVEKGLISPAAAARVVNAATAEMIERRESAESSKWLDLLADFRDLRRRLPTRMLKRDPDLLKSQKVFENVASVSGLTQALPWPSVDGGGRAASLENILDSSKRGSRGKQLAAFDSFFSSSSQVPPPPRVSNKNQSPASPDRNPQRRQPLAGGDLSASPRVRSKGAAFISLLSPQPAPLTSLWARSLQTGSSSSAPLRRLEESFEEEGRLRPRNAARLPNVGLETALSGGGRAPLKTDTGFAVGGLEGQSGGMEAFIEGVSDLVLETRDEGEGGDAIYGSGFDGVWREASEEERGSRESGEGVDGDEAGVSSTPPSSSFRRRQEDPLQTEAKGHENEAQNMMIMSHDHVEGGLLPAERMTKEGPEGGSLSSPQAAPFSSSISGFTSTGGGKGKPVSREENSRRNMGAGAPWLNRSERGRGAAGAMRKEYWSSGWVMGNVPRTWPSVSGGWVG